ncbi:MAG: AAA family ATPase, partial [Phycisphaerales bacterium JB063]
MSMELKKVVLQGFKSIEILENFHPRKLNVMIGANGAGKSNFVDFFRMLRALADGAFQKFVNDQGGGDGLFFNGPQFTREIKARVEFGENVYEFDLAPTANSAIQITEERVQYTGGHGYGALKTIGSGQVESRLKAKKDDPAQSPWGTGRGVAGHVYDAVSNWTVYHFHDTSKFAPMRREQSIRDYERLRHDASNIAGYLSHLQDKRKSTYGLIRDTVRLIAPFFDDFLFRPQERGAEELIRL